MHTHSSKRARRAGFTLVELLVVIGIIALLISILLPALKKAKDAANAAKCQNNLKTLMTAFIMFAQDHKNHLPGNKHDSEQSGGSWNEKDPERREWLGGDIPFTGGGNAAANRLKLKNSIGKSIPETGTIYKYIKNKKVYLCPTNEQNAGAGIGTGQDTNGVCDYSVFNSLSGANMSKVKPTGFYVKGGNKQNPTPVPVPIIVEEDSYHINGTNIEGGHSESDQFNHQHRGGSYYASIDASTHFFIEDKNGRANTHWFGQYPPGVGRGTAPSARSTYLESLGKDFRWDWWANPSRTTGDGFWWP